MGKKRKSVANSLDEVDRTMYTMFCTAANSLSQLYAQTINQQKLSFQAGERHGLEKLYQWILRQEEAGCRVSTLDILNYLQHELDYRGEEQAMFPRVPIQQPHSQTTTHLTNSGVFVPAGPCGTATAGQGNRSEQFIHQSRNSVFSNALSSPVRRTLQQFHFAQSAHNPNGGPVSGTRSNEPNQNRDAYSLGSNDSSMDMHADSAGHEST